MAEAFFNTLYKGDITAESAGLEPGTLNPLAVEVMDEVGIDISQAGTDSVFTLYQEGRLYAYVITVCDRTTAEKCPVFPGVTTRLHWDCEKTDTYGESLQQHKEKMRHVRDSIRNKVLEFIESIRQDDNDQGTS